MVSLTLLAKVKSRDMEPELGEKNSRAHGPLTQIMYNQLGRFTIVSLLLSSRDSVLWW